MRISKPSALILADAAEVQVSRTLKDFIAESASSSSSVPTDYMRNGTLQSSQTPSLSSLLDQLPQDPIATISLPHKAAIALGSNLGDRFANIELALRMLESANANLNSRTGTPRVLVVDTSFMYETAPMYVEDQPRFINCACMVRIYFDRNFSC